MKNAILSVLLSLVTFAGAAIEGEPIVCDAHARSVRQVEVYRAAKKTFTVYYKQSGTAMNITGLTPAMVWYTNRVGTSIPVQTSSYDVVDASAGEVDFTFAPEALNFTAGQYWYAIGLTDSGDPVTQKQGQFTIIGEAWATGVGTNGWTSTVYIDDLAWVGSFPTSSIPTLDHGSHITGLGDDDHSQYILHTELDTEAELELQIGVSMASETELTETSVVDRAYADTQDDAHSTADQAYADSVGSTVDSNNLDRDGTDPMAGNLLPDAGGTRDLGSSNAWWNSLYVGTSTVWFVDAASNVVGGVRVGTGGTFQAVSPFNVVTEFATTTDRDNTDANVTANDTDIADLLAKHTDPTLEAVLDAAGYGATNWREQVTLVTTNSNYTLTRSDSGKVFIYTGASNVLFNLPTNNTTAHLGQRFMFVNTTTNLLKINAGAGESIDDSDDDEDYELYSGSGGENAWPWSSCTLVLVDEDWWHVSSARGDWTTTGTNTSAVPVLPYIPQTSTNDTPTLFTPRHVGDRLVIYSNTNHYYIAFGTTTNDWSSTYNAAP